MARKSYRRRAEEADEGTGPVDPNLALFVSRVNEEKERERAEKRAARAERKAAEEHQRLIDAKEAAAAELKRLRQQGGAGAEKVAAADAVYRDALAALIVHETGEAPAWAPADQGVPAEPPVDHPTANEDTAEPTDAVAGGEPDIGEANDADAG